MIALCAKCYTSWNGSLEDAVNGHMIKAIKCKGVSIRQNPMTSRNYYDVITNGTTFNGKNINLCLRNSHGNFDNIFKITVNKFVLSRRHVKGVV